MQCWQVKEFAKLTGVSVRMLHHYDKIELLKPSGKKTNGYRFYSERNLVLLQQICALKSFGFTLKQVKNFLQSNTSVKEQLFAQNKLLIEKINNLQQAQATLAHLILQQTNKNLSWENVMKLIKEYKMEQSLSVNWQNILNKELYQDLLTVQAQAKDILGMSGEDYGKIFHNLSSAVKVNLTQDPSSLIGKDLGIRWLALLNLSFGAKTNIRDQIRASMNQQENIDVERVPLHINPDIRNWITKAIKFHKLS